MAERLYLHVHPAATIHIPTLTHMSTYAHAYEKKKEKVGMVAYTCNPSTGEVEAGTSLKFPGKLVLLNCELWVQ